jgi:hypothetical protein
MVEIGEDAAECTLRPPPLPEWVRIADVLVPHRLALADASREYFLSNGPWFFGGLLALNALAFYEMFVLGGR